MADCFYYKGENRINDIQDLIFEFFKDTNQLRNAAIFSSEDIQQSTLKKLRSTPGINEFNNSEIPVVTEFIVEQNPGRYNLLGIETKSGRLVPEYIKENRIYSFVKENIELVDNLSDKLDISNIKFDQENLDNLRKNSDLDSLTDNKLIFLLNKIEDLIAFEEKTKDFGNLLHRIISLKIQNKQYSNILDTFLNDPKNAEIVGNFPKEEWISKIESITKNIIDKIQESGFPISEIFLTSDIIKGKVDLITVDLSGDAHIFEIKISKNKYKDWDSAKLLGLDWQLALYRQLLGQHINIDNTMLYTIPIWVESAGDPKRIHVEEFTNRKSLSKSGLNTTGDISVKAEKILRRKVITYFDPEREKKVKDDLDKLLKGYEVKTGLQEYNEDKIVESVRKRFEKEGVWKWYNSYNDIPDLEKGNIEYKNEEEFRAAIKKYVAHAKTQVNREVSILKDSIISSIKTKAPIKTSSHDPKRDITINHLLFEFLNDDWEVLNNIPEALPMGVILLKNRKTGNLNVISLTTNQLYAKSEFDKSTYGDVEYLKTLLFINQFKDSLFPGGSGKLGQIIVYNAENSQSYYRNSFGKFKEFKERMYKMGMDKDLKLNREDILGIENIALYNLNTNFRNFSGLEKEKIERIFSPVQDTNLDLIDLDTLLDIQKEFYIEFPEYKLKTFSKEINFGDNKEVLAALLNVAITSKNGMDLAGDFQNLTKYSMGFSDFKSLFAALYTNDQAEYDETGKKIQGILGGLIFSPPDWVPSKDLKNINKIMSTANQHIGEWMVNVSAKIHTNTVKFYKDINYNEAEQNWSGETQSKYKNLWKQKNDVVTDELRTKNPYIVDLENVLTDEERIYLKNMLLLINTWKLEIPENQIEKLDVNSLVSISTNTKIKAAIEDGSYFDMPLIRREEITRFKGVFTNNGKLWRDKIKPYLEEKRDLLDQRELQKGDLDTIELQKMGFYEMYDVYGRQTPEFKAKTIAEKGIDYFELNLDTIAHRVSFNKIRKKVYDKKLPIINSYVWWIKMLAGKQNNDISNQLEYLSNQMKLSIYDEPIIDEEFKDFSTVTAIAKQISTAGMLAFKPASLIKELTIGVFKGISIAATKIYGKDQFGINDLRKAYGKLMTIDNKFANEFNLIDRMNHYYRFANMDVNTISKKLQTDRRGLFRGFGRYMYMSNTVPDYYNRLSILLAKMIHDGSYEAHTLVEGNIIYDPTKDKRFSHYLANRNKHTSNGTYIAALNDRVYNEQRQRYLLLISQLNVEYKGERTFTESDLINKAYSEIERSSLKSFSDMSYGYYDKDAQAQVTNTWWGMTWLQFMQFWPGKMKMWFAKPTDESPMGKIEQEFVIVEGKKKLMWRKTIIDEDGNINIEITEEDTGDPSLRWTGTPFEGLMYSVLGTIKDIATLDFANIKNNEERNRRVAFALADGMLIFLMLAFAKLLLDGIIEEKGTEGLSGTMLSMTSAINGKVLNEYNIYKSTMGAVSATPVFVSWGKKIAGDTWSTIQGEKEISDLITRNIGAAEVFKW